MRLGATELQQLKETEQVMQRAKIKLLALEGESDLTHHLETSIEELQELIQNLRKPRPSTSSK